MTHPVMGVTLGVLGLALAIRRGWLTRPAALVGLLAGALLVAGTHAAGPILLVAFLSSSSVLSRVRTAGPRTGWQVLANSAVPAIAALLAVAGALPCAGSAIAGAIAAVTADTWATEIGTALGAPARLVSTWRKVPPGRSGAISVPGTAAGYTGAAAIALISTYLPSAAWGPASSVDFMPVLVGGLVGMFADSFLGATVEGRIPGFNNETVNLLGSVAGAVIACLLA